MSVPFLCNFFCVHGLVHVAPPLELGYASVALAWSPKNREVFRIGRISFFLLKRFLAAVLLSASVERFDVSRMRDFYVLDVRRRL